MLSFLLSKRYGICSFQSKNVLLCLIWNFAVFFIINSLYVTGRLYHACALVLCFAGCPLAGWLADVYMCRYQFIRCSLRITWSGIIATNLYYLIDKTFKFPSAAEISLQVILTIVVGLGLAGLVANIMQFGLDQLIDASSTDICSFISWYVWLYFLAYTMAVFSQQYLCGIYDLPLSFLFVSLTITVVVLSDIAYNHWLVKEPVTHDPLKLIYQVLRYAAKNKYPRMRSAFTYWEDKPYSRIDLGKRKYGGPFTTEQVEDVKTFFQILVIIVVGILISSMIHGQVVIPDSRLENYEGGTTTLKHCEEIVHLQYFNSWLQQKLVGIISNAFIILLVPVLELLLYPLQKVYLPRLNMSIYFRINASIFLMLLSSISNLALEVVAIRGSKERNATCHFFSLSKDNNQKTLALNYRWLIIPQIITSVSQYLLYSSGTECVVSQCPYAMRGLIIGATCSCSGATAGLSLIFTQMVTWLHNSGKGFKDSNCGVWYYLAGVLSSLLMFFAFLIIGKKCYKYRRRDEDIHNKQMFAENYYEKYLPHLS